MNRSSLLGFAALGLSLAAPALASGGGGGGSTGGGWGSNPSASAERIDPAVAYREGVRLLRAGDYKGAERQLKDATRGAKDNANAHYMLGLAHEGQEEWRAAGRAFRKAIRYNPDLHDARARMGVAMVNRGKPEDAQEQLAELEARKAACAETCAEAAVIDQAYDTLAAALSGTVETSSLAPNLDLAANWEAGDAAYIEAIRLVNLERYDDALAELNVAAHAFGPHPDVLTYQGFANRKRGEYDQAIAFYTAALSISPDHVGANEYLGEYFVELGDIDAAERQLAKVEAACAFGCVEAEELRAWIDAARS